MEEEEAARTLGASRCRRSSGSRCRTSGGALLYGIALTTARAIGEIGAVLIVSGALQGQTETATLFVLRAFDGAPGPAGLRRGARRSPVSILLLVGIEVFKRVDQGRGRNRAHEHADRRRAA